MLEDEPFGVPYYYLNPDPNEHYLHLGFVISCISTFLGGCFQSTYTVFLGIIFMFVYIFALYRYQKTQHKSDQGLIPPDPLLFDDLLSSTE